MNFDTFSVAAMAAELRATILEGRVQQVTQINSLAYGLEIFVHPVRHYLILSAEPQAPRLHLSDDRVRRGVGNETPLMLVLRKYMRGAILQEIEQPPYERILHFRFKTRFGLITLTIELLGTRSNLLLVDEDQTILGVARLPKAEGRRRLIPGYFYEPPPPQQHRPPAEFNEFVLRQELEEASPPDKAGSLAAPDRDRSQPFCRPRDRLSGHQEYQYHRRAGDRLGAFTGGLPRHICIFLG